MIENKIKPETQTLEYNVFNGYKNPYRRYGS